VCERAVRLVADQQPAYETQWAAMGSIAEKFGCSPDTLRLWVRRAERDPGQRPCVTTDDRARLTVLERENRELKRINEILRTACAFFAAAELDASRSNSFLYAFIDASRVDYGVEPICRVLEIAPSAYYVSR